MADLVVIGGDAAGMSAASKAKRVDPSLDIVVFERGEWTSYGACGLPYYVKGEIESLDDLVAVTPEEFREHRDVDVRTETEAVEIDVDASEVAVEGPEGSYRESFDDLLIATGARALEPPVEGLDLDGVHTFQSMDAGRALKRDVERLDGDGVAGVVGGGYVGVELAEAFHARGLDVCLFEMLPHVLAPFGEESARVVEDHLREHDVGLHLDTAVEALEGDGSVERVRTERDEFEVDVVVVGAGVVPNVEIAEQAGVETGETGAIATDEYGETSVDGVYAAGDCAESTHAVTGEVAHVPLALTANRAGRAVGSTVAGEPTETGEIAGTATLKAFDLEVARTGLLEREASEAGFDVASVTVDVGSRAHYYPGGTEIQVTLTGDRDTGRLLGVSMVGREGVAHRVNSVATALHAGVTVEELESMDFAYAPPFSPVWDPVLTAAKVLGGEV
ncbi:MAG: FAD-dependent oxidoreductase [Halobacteriales archaeon]